MKHIFHTTLFFSFLLSYSQVHAFQRQEAEQAEIQSNLSFFEACEINDLNRIVTLLNLDPRSIDYMNHAGDTGLHLAIVFGHTQLAQYLISRGANINLKGMIGMTPLQLALIHKNDILIKKILEHQKLDLQAYDRHGCSTAYYINNLASLEIKTLFQQKVLEVAA
jgi:ankyrin repeat protein